VIRRVTRGWIGLPVLVERNAVGLLEDRVPLGRIVVIDRSAPGVGGAAARLWIDDDPDRAWRLIDAIASRDLAWVAAQGGDWNAVAEETRRIQLETLRRAVVAAGAEVTVVAVPGGWSARRAIDALAAELDIERPSGVGDVASNG
jgi:hypothetical protein